jgi:hypothetical protein
MEFRRNVAFALLSCALSVGCSSAETPLTGGSGTGGNDSGATGEGIDDSGSGSAPDSSSTFVPSVEDAGDAGTVPDSSVPEDVNVGPSCLGTPTPCALLASCTTAGCSSTGGGCSGTSIPCFEIFSSFQCSSQEGCYWETSSNSCSGLATPCNENSSETACIEADGCSWQEASCSGTPLLACSSATSTAACELIAGCIWE